MRLSPTLPWKAFEEPQPDREYLVVLTFLPLRRLWKLPAFLAFVRKIQQQLNAGPDGLIGYSLLAKPLRSNYWTLSVWGDVAVLALYPGISTPRSDAGAAKKH